MRLDKFLVAAGCGSRKEVKKYCKDKRIAVDGILAKKSDQKIDEKNSTVTLDGKNIEYREFIYIMMNKPAGVISATIDRDNRTVIDLLSPELQKRGLFPVGRLDMDTEGLLLLTDDGEMSHRLLSPNKKVPKTYYVKALKNVEHEDINRFNTGLDLGDFQTAPAEYIAETEKSGYLTITEGKFHQVKRMFKATCNKVLYLKRVSMAGLTLDPNLMPGQYRELTEEEIESLYHIVTN